MPSFSGHCRLDQRLAELIGQSRRVEADIVGHIAEVEERRLYAREAFPSMFVYCLNVLHLSEPEGERAGHKTKRQIEELIADIAPRPDVPAMVRKLPEGRTPPTAGIVGVPEPQRSLGVWSGSDATPSRRSWNT